MPMELRVKIDLNNYAFLDRCGNVCPVNAHHAISDVLNSLSGDIKRGGLDCIKNDTNVYDDDGNIVGVVELVETETEGTPGR